MTQQDRCLWLIRALLKDMPQYSEITIPSLPERRWQLLRSLMNVRPPMPMPEEFYQVQNEFLQEMTEEKGVVDAEELMPSMKEKRLAIWQGDITTLRCDAIVNAANSQMLGCFSPCHGCIDNIIHTMAGIQLRLACDQLMQAQGHEEPTGQAKITPGFNLPARYVLHTVGPIIDDEVTEEDERLLASCYRSCLTLASENGCQSIAFCCISTGVFMFPNQRAAEIAVSTVRDWLDETGSQMKVIFNMYKDLDLQIYQQLLER
ncbi:MAG: protein-ADP-ribose hydrolase [Clostridia bacterium]|nr:protein-ADP-ribose hydrolase [Clostridia bacterium]